MYGIFVAKRCWIGRRIAEFEVISKIMKVNACEPTGRKPIFFVKGIFFGEKLKGNLKRKGVT